MFKERMVSVGGGGFRKADNDYFKWIHSIRPAERQVSPFIILRIRDTHTVASLHNLLLQEPSVNVLQAWPGKRRTDVFHFHLCDLIKWREKNAIST